MLSNRYWRSMSHHHSFSLLSHSLVCLPAALLPLHLGHGQQRLGAVRPRQGRPLVRAGRLLGGDPQQAARHLPGRALLQAAAHRRWRRHPPAPPIFFNPLTRVRSCVQVMVDVEGKNEWRECIDFGGVRLPTGYFFGASAATGDLSGELSGSLA